MTGLEITTPGQLREVMHADFTFSEQQFAAVTAPLEPAVVVAGAGSGKTTVMAARVVWLVATGRVQPGEVLGLTFTTKATAELGGRIRESLRLAGLLPERGPRGPGVAGAGAPGERDEEGEDGEEPTVATYHSYAAGLLDEHGLRIGHEPGTRLLADASRYQLAARAVQRYTRPVALLSDSPRHVVQYLLGLDAEMSEHLVGPDDVREHDARVRPLLERGMAGESRKTYRERNEKAISALDRRGELLGLVEAYRDLKAAHGVMDFSDQIALAARLAREQPEVGRAERAKFRVVLLDEYQDTSVAQALMLSRLFSGAEGADGRAHPVTAVGDPNQAIYGWRGASVSNILEFAVDFPPSHGPGRTFPLTVNRRSDERILATANHLAADLYDRADLRPLEAKPDAAPGEVDVAVHPTYDDELAWVVEQVRSAHAELAAREDRPAWREIGVLTRDNAHAAALFDALTDAEVPVEIVGLKGLLRLPEVSEVVATLALVDDVSANAELLTLLAGPRWAVGPRDLALLGRRSRELAAGLRTGPGRRGAEAPADLATQLDEAVQGADPWEVPALSDALEDPGDLAYSEAARERFALLAGELRRLRSLAGEPLLDLVRRIVDVTGIDVELASSVSPAAAARRDNLDLFVSAVADFQAVDGSVSLSALLAWLEAEDEFGQGLDVATPSEADSVKLLTVHRAKGLEWDVVVLPGVVDGKFPTSRGRSSWLTVPSVLPVALRGDARDLPTPTGWTPADLQALASATKEHEAREELRLGYVAWTRARHRLLVSGWCWSPTIQRPRGPSAYLLRTREAMAGWGAQPGRWCETPGKDDPHPYHAADPDRAWPIDHHTAEVVRRHEAAALLESVDPDAADELDDVLHLEQVSRWDDAVERLVAEATRERSSSVAVPLPSSLSVTALTRLRADPARFARDLARPMPRQPSPSARFGTRFHAWVEARFGQQLLLDPDDLPGRADADIEDDADLAALVAAFEAGAFAERAPYAVEAPFALVLAGQVVRGRIDAVYAEQVDGEPGFLLVDWKTNRSHDADPVQLALYRLAWAELHGVGLDRVRAGFYYVRSGDLVEPADLPGRGQLEAILRPSG